MGHAIVSKLAMLGDLCSCSLSTAWWCNSSRGKMLWDLFVCMYICLYVSVFFFVLCYYAILTRQFTVSFFCLVPVDLETRFKSPLKDFLKDIGIHTVW